MAAKSKDKRPIIKLRSTADTGYVYVTRKNKINSRERLELKKYDPGLHAKPRWLVLNKIDMIPEAERAARVKAFVSRLRWKGPVFAVSALARQGLQPLIEKIHAHVSEHQRPAAEPDPRFAGDASASGGADE